jgi:hypothetical protein
MDGFLFTGLTVGLVGSLHCIGMCGPIALAVPSHPLAYNLGRVATYALLGFGMGLVGAVVVLAGTQQGISIAAGAVVALGALWTLNRSRLPKWSVAAGAGAWLSARMMPLWRGGRWWHMAGVGLLNGILPCGFVYVGLAGSLTVADPLGSAGYMALFGLGTIPAMWLTGVAGRKAAGPWRDRIRRATPWLALLLGILMMLRGMELGIPFVSPVLAGAESCH